MGARTRPRVPRRLGVLRCSFDKCKVLRLLHQPPGRGESVINDPDLLRAARFMIDKYGEHAALMAAKRAHDLVMAGQRQAAAIWIRVGFAAAQILAEHRN